MEAIVTNEITAGDIIVHRGEVYQVVPGECSRCEMMNHRVGRCRGYCYRWPNMEGLIFRFVGYEITFDDRCKAYTSPDSIGDELKRRGIAERSII